MFAIIETGGKQYKIENGSILDIEKIEAKEGSPINFDKVLLISDKGKVKVGTPFISGASATAKIISHDRKDKIKVFKMKSKKRYKKTQGHKQHSTKVEITNIKS